MNSSSHEGRHKLEVIHFALAFYGSIVAVAGIVTNLIPVTLAGGAIAGWGIFYFLMAQVLSD